MQSSCSGQSKTNHSDSTQASHSKDGVDLTLIRWMLSLTPKQRLLTLQQHVRSVMELRRATR